MMEHFISLCRTETFVIEVVPGNLFSVFSDCRGFLIFALSFFGFPNTLESPLLCRKGQRGFFLSQRARNGPFGAFCLSDDRLYQPDHKRPLKRQKRKN